MTQHQQELQKMLLGQLKVTEADLKEWEHNMYLMDSMTVSRFWDYVEDAPAVAIVGDYDCDGICASYILGKAIKEKFPGKNAYIRIPRRLSEGYGINQSIADEFREGVPERNGKPAKAPLPKGSLIVTVDNGIAAAPLLESLMRDGFKVIMTDHHELGNNKIPKVNMALDPVVDGINDAFCGRNYWCGAAVAYKISEQVISERLAKELEVFAGLATVADCMELKEGNWGIVKRAIQAFREKRAPESLVQFLLGMRQAPEYADADTFGFYLGPAFNAPGRLVDDGPSAVLGYLLRPSQEKCEQLLAINELRKQLKESEYAVVKEQIIATHQENACPIWIAVSGLHEGILGILAGMITEEYNTAAIVMTESEKDHTILKGSARSVDGVDIFEFLKRNQDLLSKFGGHPKAGGLSMPIENFEKAKKLQTPNPMKSSEQQKDRFMRISHGEIPLLVPIIEATAPYGEGNPAPKFGIDVNVAEDGAQLFGKEHNHLKIDRTVDEGYQIIHYRHTPNELNDKDRFELIGKISKSGFRGYDYALFNADEAIDLIDAGERELDMQHLERDEE